jgi:GNAT superfamily N-acetyltransferase
MSTPRSISALRSPAEDGRLVAGDRDGSVLRFVAQVFDHAGRPGLTKFMPVDGDRVWSWRDRRGDLLGAMFTRSWRLIDGLAGVNLGYVCVRPEQRRKGVGASMVRAVVAHEEEAGAAFTMCWARDHLVEFYRGLGFADLGTEAYCEITPSATDDAGDVEVADIGEVSHSGFDSLRRDRAGAVLRAFDHGAWRGINPGFPWAPVLKVIYAGKPTQPDWYAIVGQSGDSVTIVEYGGRPDQFTAASRAVRLRLNAAHVRINLTDPSVAQMASELRGPEIGVPFHRLLRSNLIDRAAAPVTSWLDRI